MSHRIISDIFSFIVLTERSHGPKGINAGYIAFVMYNGHYVSVLVR